jgi:hypothetical protein
MSRHHRFGIPALVASAGLIMAIGGSAAVAADATLLVRIEAGRSDRQETPIRVEVARDALPGPRPPRWRLREWRDGRPTGPEWPVQVEPAEGGKVRLTWVLAGRLPAGSTRTYRLDPDPSAARDPWTLIAELDGTLHLKNRERSVFRYNTRPASHPNYGPIQRRDAYIHPAFTPSGALITGDFSKAHTHHRGFFLAYTKTQWGSLHPDFWNIQGGSGKIAFDHDGPTFAGPVVARFTAFHRWEARDPKSGESAVVLRERWDVEAYDIPGQPYWLFDLTSTQEAVGRPLELVPYRYGGLAYRGPDPFLKGPLDVLTSEGLDRRRGDQKPARWVDLTGPIEEGSSTYGGAMIADHPSNVHHPTVARIHPTTLPFFCFVPAHDKPVTIGTDAPAVFRYRVLIHDGHPDRDRNERIWRDFAEPPRVVVEPATP